jgi:glutathione synthase/RimK-type ligase-like ATP-grasp enzyme
VRAATRAANLIGDGLYGVDVKLSGERVCIIEVNDNPSIESKVEDAYLGDDLYRIIMEEFLRRLERKRLGV